jgi:hypothetical protein
VSVSRPFQTLSDRTLERCRVISGVMIFVGTLLWIKLLSILEPKSWLVTTLLICIALVSIAFPFFSILSEKNRREEEEIIEMARRSQRYKLGGTTEGPQWFDVEDEEVPWTNIEQPDPEHWHVILGVRSDDSKEMVRKAFVHLAMKLHPDQSGGKGDAAKIREVINAWNEARQERGWP